MRQSKGQIMESGSRLARMGPVSETRKPRTVSEASPVTSKSPEVSRFERRHSACTMDASVGDAEAMDFQLKITTNCLGCCVAPAQMTVSPNTENSVAE